jgi:hypothetical protein
MRPQASTSGLVYIRRQCTPRRARFDDEQRQRDDHREHRRAEQQNGHGRADRLIGPTRSHAVFKVFWDVARPDSFDAPSTVLSMRTTKMR